jgi:IMP dehydrogenase
MSRRRIAAGADTVMIGSLFAGTDEAPGEIILYQGRSYKMLPRHGLDRRDEGRLEGPLLPGRRRRRRRSSSPRASRAACPTRAALTASIYQLVGGLRAGMGYVGARDIARSGREALRAHLERGPPREPRPRRHHHEEAPNYRVE